MYMTASASTATSNSSGQSDDCSDTTQAVSRTRRAGARTGWRAGGSSSTAPDSAARSLRGPRSRGRSPPGAGRDRSSRRARTTPRRARGSRRRWRSGALRARRAPARGRPRLGGCERRSGPSPADLTVQNHDSLHSPGARAGGRPLRDTLSWRPGTQSPEGGGPRPRQTIDSTSRTSARRRCRRGALDVRPLRSVASAHARKQSAPAPVFQLAQARSSSEPDDGTT